MHAIKQYLYDQGASLVGFARLHGLELPGTRGMPFAISIACTLPLEVTESIRNGPTMAYYLEYRTKNAFLNRIGLGVVGLIRSTGYKAYMVDATVEDTGRRNYLDSFGNNFPHKTAATLSGLGWIGRSSLFVSLKYGPRVRLGTVLTDMPLNAEKAISTGKCDGCAECIKACPVAAIKGSEWKVGVSRDDLLDAHTCRKKALKFGAGLGVKYSLCGICIQACPVGREDPA